MSLKNNDWVGIGILLVVLYLIFSLFSGRFLGFSEVGNIGKAMGKAILIFFSCIALSCYIGSKTSEFIGFLVFLALLGGLGFSFY